MAPLRLALTADPAQALAALVARLRGQRVRARRLIGEAAARHPAFHAWWTARRHPAAVAQWCAAQPLVADAPRHAVLILPGPDSAEARTRASLLRTLPDAPVLIPAATLEATLEEAAAHGAAWLIVLRAGDRLGSGADGVLARLPGDPAIDLVYWDHDAPSAGDGTGPVVKPDWDPLLALRCELLGPAASLRIAAAQALLSAEPSAARAAPVSAAAVGRLQHALALRAAPRHIPLILTHAGSPAPFLPAEGRRNLLAGFGPEGVPEGLPWPGVTIVIPTRDQAALLEACLGSLDRLDYPGPVERLVLDNGSVEPATAALFARLAGRSDTRVVPWPGAFNFAAMMNRAAELAEQPFLCLLNNDVEALDGNWLGALVAHARKPDVGAAGARLLYPDGAIQHAGVAVGIGGAAGHVAKGTRPDEADHALWHSATRRVSAVTAACLVVERAKFVAAGGMDAMAFAVDFNDVDLCLRLDQAGWQNRVVMEATLVHHESRSRGRQRTGPALARFDAELAELRRRWQTDVARDPWYSPLLSPESERCRLRC